MADRGDRGRRSRPASSSSGASEARRSADRPAAVAYAGLQRGAGDQHAGLLRRLRSLSADRAVPPARAGPVAAESGPVVAAIGPGFHRRIQHRGPHGASHPARVRYRGRPGARRRRLRPLGGAGSGGQPAHARHRLRDPVARTLLRVHTRGRHAGGNRACGARRSGFGALRDQFGTRRCARYCHPGERGGRRLQTQLGRRSAGRHSPRCGAGGTFQPRCGSGCRGGAFAARRGIA